MSTQSWFAKAKLGIFVHWGIYSVAGYGESWPMFFDEPTEGYVPVSPEVYMAQARSFTAASYDADKWARIFKASGARYAVLTTRHHDGVALWDSAASDLTVVKATPAGGDLVRPFVDALREHGLRVGLYYSLSNWSHPDYATVRPESFPYGDSRIAYPEPGSEEPSAWSRYLTYMRAELSELCTGFGDIDLFWFDGDWEREDAQWGAGTLREWLDIEQPNAVINARLCSHGDYASPEQGIPIVAPPGPWELAITLTDSWCWRPGDEPMKSARQLVRLFAQVIGMGGNLLLNVGPREDGVIEAAQTERLTALGEWIDRHQDAIFDTDRGLPDGHFYGASTLSEDRRALFLFAFDPPTEFIEVRGLRGIPTRVSTVGVDVDLEFRQTPGVDDIPGILYVTVPPEVIDPLATVFRIDFDEPIELYRGAGRGDETATPLQEERNV